MEKFSRQYVKVSQPDLLAKWGAEVLKEGFVPFPKRLLRCLKEVLSGDDALNELAAILAVVDFKRSNLTRQPSSEFLAFTMGATQQDFHRALVSLHKKGLLQIEGDSTGITVSIDGLQKMIIELTAHDEPSE